MWTVSFWKQSAERAIKSAAQILLLLWAGDGLFNVIDADFEVAAGAAGGAALLSLLTSIASSGVGPSDGPSLVSTEPATE